MNMFCSFRWSRLRELTIIAFGVIGVWHSAQGQIANNDFYVAPEGSAFTVSAPGVLANDTGSNLTATLVNGPANGTFTLNADGSFIYTPTNNFTGVDGFTYQAGGSSGSGLATVEITVVAPGELFYDNCTRATNSGSVFPWVGCRCQTPAEIGQSWAPGASPTA